MKRTTHDPRRDKKQDMTPEQQAALKGYNAAIKTRNTKDMHFLKSRPEFLRFLSRWFSECGVNEAVEGDHPNDIFHMEGRRYVGERMREELKAIDQEAVFEVERIQTRDADQRRRILGGEMFNAGEFEAKFG